MNLEFDESTGLLLPGEYKISIQEFEKLFVYNDKRKYIYEKFKSLMDIFRSINCTHIYIDGSFVTKKPLPGDIDVCWHMDEDRNKRDKQLRVLSVSYPFLFHLNKKENREFNQANFCADVFPANIKEARSDVMFKDFFQRDKNTQKTKGIVIIDLI